MAEDKDFEKAIHEAVELILSAEYVVALTGAGISVESVAGHFGVPIGFLSGCDKAVDEGRAHFGDIEAVEVKKGLGRASAILLPPSISSKLLEEGAYRATKRLNNFKPFKVEEPMKIEVEFSHTGMADATEMTPYSKRVDGLTVTFEDPFVESC